VCTQIRPDRQIVMLSATWPREVEDIAARYTYFPITVRVGSQELLANCNVSQKILAVTDEEFRHTKFMELIGILKKGRTLIFAEHKSTVDSLYNDLVEAGVPALALHGDMEQQRREQVIESFKTSESACLVATNIASRGLDIKGLDVVVNYTFPTNLDDYVHRIGRTGRAGRLGCAFTFVSKSDNMGVVAKLINVMKRAKQSPPQCLFDLLNKTPDTFAWDADLMPNATPVVPVANFVRDAPAAYPPHGNYAPPANYPPRAPIQQAPPVPPVGQKRQRESTFSAYGDGPGEGGSERW
jgi:superfamily II DNA/RNA helicase